MHGAISMCSCLRLLSSVKRLSRARSHMWRSSSKTGRVIFFNSSDDDDEDDDEEGSDDDVAGGR